MSAAPDFDPQDAFRSERQARLTGKGLTAAKVRAIRADKRKQREIAAAYGISVPMVSLIRARKKWANVV